MARQRLYEILDDDESSLAEKQHRTLALGVEYFGVEAGQLQVPDEGADTHSIVASVGAKLDGLAEGASVDRTATYCRRTVERTEPVALSDAGNQGWEDDPAYEEHGFDCYLGTAVLVDGETYGSVCFLSNDPREREFTTDERMFIELLARLLGREIEATERARRLGEHERARERIANKHEALLDQAPDAIIHVDDETGEITDANAEAASLTGYTESELRGRQVTDLHPPDDRARYGKLFTSPDESARETFDDGSSLYVRHADGSDTPVEISVTTVEFEERTLVQAVVRDITDRRRRERDLRLKNRAIEEASVGITIADATADDRPLVYANPAFERLTGYDRTDVLGRNCRFLQGPETESEPVEEIRTALNEEETVRTELRNYRADGTPFWNGLTITPVSGADSEDVGHFIGFQRDVTSEKRQNRVIGMLHRVLRHNLRNRLTVIAGNANCLAEHEEPAVADMADRIADAAAELNDLSEKAGSIETFVGDAEEQAPRDVGADAEAVVSKLETEHPDTEFVVETPDSAEVTGTYRLRQAIRELGENAAVHTDSTVAVRVEKTADGDAAVTISDDGPGLSETERRVLEEGAESPLEHGTGLGHWLVNWIVTGLGGEVTATCDDEVSVTLRFPLADDATPNRVPTAPDQRRAAGLLSDHRLD